MASRFGATRYTPRRLSFQSPSFESLEKAGLVRRFEPERSVELPRGLKCLPIPIPHDSDPTFAFRVEGAPGLFGGSWSLGYAADLGIAPSRLLDLFHDVHLLALEFNHDEEMQRQSGRPRQLIDRVMGDHGHLSNNQAAESLRTILHAAPQSNLRHVVQLHLSHQCNRPVLAQTAAKSVLNGVGQTISGHTAHQDRPTRLFELS